jgi:hypothetical protein
MTCLQRSTINYANITAHGPIQAAIALKIAATAVMIERVSILNL